MRRFNKILVTGASGQLGRKLIRKLDAAGYSVRAHFRSVQQAERWNIPNAEPVLGDLLEDGWLDKAVDGCDGVIHCAAWVSMRQVDSDLMYRINVGGTKKVAEACRTAESVKRLIQISSVAAVGGSADNRPLDETAEFNLLKYEIPYFTTKYLSEKKALEYNDGNLEVIAVNPSIMISPPDREVTENDLAKIPKRIPFYFDFGLNLVQTDDVINGIIAALENGRPGQRYILGGENIDAKKIFDLAYKYFGIKKPLFKIPYFAFIIAGAAMSGYGKLITLFLKRGYVPKFSLPLARLMKYRFIYSSVKATDELNHKFRSLESSLKQILSGLDSTTLSKLYSNKPNLLQNYPKAVGGKQNPT